MKAKRDITLGEMQDECKGTINDCDRCKYESVCVIHKNRFPSQIDLTDPTRFTGAQMEFWCGLHAMGIKTAHCSEDGTILDLFDGKRAFITSRMAIIEIPCGLRAGETIDLADVLGKDGANANK